MNNNISNSQPESDFIQILTIASSQGVRQWLVYNWLDIDNWDIEQTQNKIHFFYVVIPQYGSFKSDHKFEVRLFIGSKQCN